MFNSLCLQTDVTCIEIIDKHVFAGIGGFLHIYQLPNNNLIKRLKIFEGQKIYGIKPNLNLSKLIIFGGKHISLTSCPQGNFEEIEKSTHHILSDWILAVKWIENDNKIATVFMHNKLTIWNKDFLKEISVKCEERCILYSAHICYDSHKELLILSGTVFSEVLLWKPLNSHENKCSPVLKRLKEHNGVIFSIDYNPDNGLICATSDDRSAVLWKMTSTNPQDIQINKLCQVYEHLARIFRCLILKECFITVGEDSLIIVWDFNGSLLRKIETHQGGAVWSLGYNKNLDVICSGGNDGAITTFRVNPKVVKDYSSLPNREIPKIVGLLRAGNMICLSEKAVLYYHDVIWQEVARYPDLQKYCILQISPCKRLFALAGFDGQIYIYRENHLINKFFLQHKSRIFAFHWLDCNRFLVTQKDGILILYFIFNNTINFIQSFIFPSSKERWPTCACALNDHIILGDRKGNIYNFKIGHESPINTQKKSHSYLGVTYLYFENNLIISLGRDGFIKRYKLSNNNLECIDSNKTKFSWLVGLENNLLLSFSGDNFVVSDFKFQRILFETKCGGGHRSWDYVTNSKSIIFSFIKQKIIHTCQLNMEDFMPKDVIEGFHVREINALKVLKLSEDYHLVISGGEDTILRLSIAQFNRIKILETFKIHLSSIRAINYYKLNINKYLLITAGGRAQIICWQIEIQDEKISCIEKCNFYESVSQEEGETRIMHLCIANIHEQLYLFAGRSDGLIKIFSISTDMNLKLENSISHSNHCISNLALIKGGVNIDLLASMATDGNLKFWSISDICYNQSNEALNFFKIHQSGITSFSYILKDDRLITLTGGDDNCISLTLFGIHKQNSFISLAKINVDQNFAIHCAQITGAFLLNGYFITSSIDQRIVISKWLYKDNEVKFSMLEKYDTAIADPQGLEAILDKRSLYLYIFGNGIECVKVNI
ncbi:unnamed protein product [Ceutorhynchus assimilis]|uniref:tRNA (34-2'-O)-methyltransferase regulator WDR6 n=1 Tax=Ceutorhynchus assimilis TaxID=467358 RepID=A0A9N9MV74_9CUCU|nr:unnamed protein product [Ceutorhynchus assimilis]